MSDITAKSNAKSGLTVSQIAVIGVMTAATCVLAPLSLPIGPVPISLTNLVIYFSLYTLGTMKGTIMLDLIDERTRNDLFPVGRLDKDTERCV